jgi:lipopolysaccharide transport system ATP-binding protein
MSSENAIDAKGIGKRFEIGASQGPYQLLTETITERVKAMGRRPQTQEFWALRDVDFEVKHGETFGIIGHNGAGKSTLLKILSRITPPTEGEVRLRGRVGALLEVGTGFHPELTGRENIFFNGVLLGMSRSEVARKFDEIVAFSEVERFLDTPVKYYSSGMYVRLAFAVAAHLEPEVLIVDEVLAVGDAAFQRKSLGKMRDATRAEGRTVIFVSHNMAAVGSLCTRGILLSDGRIAAEGEIGEVVDLYSETVDTHGEAVFERRPGRDVFVAAIRLRSLRTQRTVGQVAFREPFALEIEAHAERPLDAVVGIGLLNEAGHVITAAHTDGRREPQLAQNGRSAFAAGPNRFRLEFPTNVLRPGRYFVNCGVYDRSLVEQYDGVERGLAFDVTAGEGAVVFDESQPGLVFPPDVTWERDD